MAGRGPAPGANPARKPDGVRRNRSKGPQFEELPAEGYAGEYPPLPSSWRIEVSWTEPIKDPDTGDVIGEKTKTKFVSRRYLKATREWYESLATSPMATEFTGFDWTHLQLVVAPLVDQYSRGPSTKLAAELRLQGAGYGFNPMDRRRLGKKIGKPEEQDPAPRPRAGRSRADLRAV